MSFFRTKLRKTDRLWTKYIRRRDNFTCQKCGRVYDPKKTTLLKNLGVSHYWGRGRENTRYDEDNCICLCSIPCHQAWGHGDERDAYKELMKKRLGEKGFGDLELRAHLYKKKDNVSDELYIKALLGGK